MKGAIAAMVYAAGAFRASGAPGAVRLVLTADEESGGDAGAAWLAQEGLIAGDAAIVGEPSGVRADWDQIRIVSRGVCLVRFFVDGDQIHSSLSDQVDAVSATLMMARLMTRLDHERSGVLRYRPHQIGSSGPTFNVGLDVSGGEGAGFLAQRANFLCDIRMLPDMRRQEVEEDLQAFLDRAVAADPALRARFQIELWRDGSEVPSTAPIVEAIQRASKRVLGRVPPVGVFPGGTDAPFFQAMGIDTVPGFGPGCLSLAHRPNEWVAEQSITEAARLYALAALELVSASS
jgi:acetylornithine deacetylase/succinyl-diaminopimelate desuccinylase-like protein